MLIAKAAQKFTECPLGLRPFFLSDRLQRLAATICFPYWRLEVGTSQTREDVTEVPTGTRAGLGALKERALS